MGREKKTMAMVYKDGDKSYDLSLKWLHAVEKFNPECGIKFISTPIGFPTYAVFDHVFEVFAPSIEVFKYCGPVISIDATFLYKKYRAKMIVTTVDKNNQIFLLSFTIVDKESTDICDGFLACLRYHVISHQNICLISDWHACVLSIVKNEHLGWQPPNTYHIYCPCYIESNFNTKFRDTKLRNLIKKIRMQT